MEPAIAFNAWGIEGAVPRDGFRIYLQPEGVYFIRVGNLDRIAAPAKPDDFVGVSNRNLLLGFFVHWVFLFWPGRSGRVSGRDLLRKIEEQPLEERLGADPSNFVLTAADFASAAIRSGGGSLWRRGFGTWGFRLQDGRFAVLEFYSRIDRLIAQKGLASMLQDRLEVEKA